MGFSSEGTAPGPGGGELDVSLTSTLSSAATILTPVTNLCQLDNWLEMKGRSWCNDHASIQLIPFRNTAQNVLQCCYGVRKPDWRSRHCSLVICVSSVLELKFLIIYIYCAKSAVINKLRRRLKSMYLLHCLFLQNHSLYMAPCLSNMLDTKYTTLSSQNVPQLAINLISISENKWLGDFALIWSMLKVSLSACQINLTNCRTQMKPLKPQTYGKHSRLL